MADVRTQLILRKADSNEPLRKVAKIFLFDRARASRPFQRGDLARVLRKGNLGNTWFLTKGTTESVIASSSAYYWPGSQGRRHAEGVATKILPDPLGFSGRDRQLIMKFFVALRSAQAFVGDKRDGFFIAVEKLDRPLARCLSAMRFEPTWDRAPIGPLDARELWDLAEPGRVTDRGWVLRPLHETKAAVLWRGMLRRHSAGTVRLDGDDQVIEIDVQRVPLFQPDMLTAIETRIALLGRRIDGGEDW